MLYIINIHVDLKVIVSPENPWEYWVNAYLYVESFFIQNTNCNYTEKLQFFLTDGNSAPTANSFSGEEFENL